MQLLQVAAGEHIGTLFKRLFVLAVSESNVHARSPGLTIVSIRTAYPGTESTEVFYLIAFHLFFLPSHSRSVALPSDSDHGHYSQFI